MICEVDMWGNFLSTWTFLTVMTAASTTVMSGIVFHYFYVKVTYEKWVYKSNPKFPAPEKVRDEIIQMYKGVATAALAPALSLWLSKHGMSQGYCGMPEGISWGYTIAQVFIIWIVSDFVEFYYHRLGHTYKSMWEIHKHHHVFYNPSPFSVIADEYVDQFVRALPLALFPLVMPTNMDLLFGVYAIFFYGYGIYLHWGYELEWPDAHHPWINTAFQHYIHHAKSINKKPYHTGFFFKLWDNMFGSVYDGECVCSKCSRARGERTPEAFKQVVIPDYSPLLTVNFWSEALSKDTKTN
eukprot:GFYU01003310.1.p1 GENE.GFYU01003310.1~~GFYU01003310.1.p1  ORF type:complete len:297 (-),score=109.20 GFYU01003310.1:175-1065(-)